MNNALMEIALRYYSNQEDAEDAVSEAILSLHVCSFQNDQEYQRRVSRTIFDHAYEKGLVPFYGEEPKRNDETTMPPEYEEENPESLLIRVENMRFVEALLDRMGQRTAELIRLREFDGFSYKEMADASGISETEACNSYRKGLEQLKTLAHKGQRRLGDTSRTTQRSD